MIQRIAWAWYNALSDKVPMKLSKHDQKDAMGMQTEFTEADAEKLLELSKTDGSTVRLVDPVSQQVCDIAGNPEGHALCSSFWGKCNRCENCTSLRALTTEGMAYKIEIMDKRTYLVVSRFLCIEGMRHILEVVTDITDSLIMDSTQVDEVGQIISNYNYLLITDPLTNVYNRRFLDDYFLPSLDCCHEQGIAVNVCIMDLDGFKQVNDTYGHQAGDALLKDVAGFWRRRFDSREKNAERLVIRYGGDEILVIACGMQPERFKADIDKSYRQMRKICYCENDLAVPFSISFGLAISTEVGDDWTWNALFGLADKRLYEHKSAPEV